MPHSIRSHAFRFAPPPGNAALAAQRLPHPSWIDEGRADSRRAVSAADFWRRLGL